jgi:uncharacterized protein (TIGR03435 family)
MAQQPPGSQLPRAAEPPASQYAIQSPEPQPDFPPSYQVHILPTIMAKPGITSTSRGNYWVARGWDLKSMIPEAWHVDRSRLDITNVNLDERYDFAMVLPQPETQETIYQYVRQAIQDQFQLRIALEPESKDVYVLTAPNGLSPSVKILPKVTHGAFGSGMGLSDHSLSANGITTERLSHMLERFLGRLIVDETKIDDRFDVNVHGEGQGRYALIALLRDKVGLVLTPDHRVVEMLVVR